MANRTAENTHPFEVVPVAVVSTTFDPSFRSTRWMTNPSSKNLAARGMLCDGVNNPELWRIRRYRRTMRDKNNVETLQIQIYYVCSSLAIFVLQRDREKSSIKAPDVLRFLILKLQMGLTNEKVE